LLARAPPHCRLLILAANNSDATGFDMKQPAENRGLAIACSSFFWVQYN
jgi:hypothetical protein